MSKRSVFSAVFMLMPDQEAAQCLLLLKRDEQLALLQEVKDCNAVFLPAAVAAAQLPSLLPLQQFESKIGNIMMSAAELAGADYVAGLLKEWTECNPALLQSLRQHMFFFEEVVHLPDRTVQRALQEMKLSPLLLLGVNDKVAHKLLSNVSRRVAGQVTEELHQLEADEETATDAQLAKGAFARLITTLLKTEEPGNIETPLLGIIPAACDASAR